MSWKAKKEILPLELRSLFAMAILAGISLGWAHAELGNNICVTVIIALVEEVRFLLLHQIGQEVEQQGKP